MECLEKKTNSYNSKYATRMEFKPTICVLDLGLYILDGVRRFNFQSDGRASGSLNKNLHSSSQAQNQMQSGLLLDVVVRQSTPILKLLASKDQTLLIRRDTFLVLNLGFDIVNCIRRLDLKSDGLASQCLHKDLHVETVEEKRTANWQFNLEFEISTNFFLTQMKSHFELYFNENCDCPKCNQFDDKVNNKM